MHAGLRYVGDPLIDNGVAVLTVASGASRPEEVTFDQLEPFIEEMRRIYITPFMSNYLGAVIFANVNFANPGMMKRRDLDSVRQKRLDLWFSLTRGDRAILEELDPRETEKIEFADEGERCVFSGDLAALRLSRTLIPMTSSEDAINFLPQGRPRLPISRWCLLALLAMPMASLNSEGRVLLVHTPDTDLLQFFAASHLRRNREDMLLAGLEKRPNYKFARTHIMSELLHIRRNYNSRYPVTVYRFTSSAKNASVEIHNLSSHILSFVDSAQRIYPASWNEIVGRSWHKNARDEFEKDGQISHLKQNHFYEDLFSLPVRANAFLRTYLLRHPLKGAFKGDPRRSYSPLRERQVVSQGLIDLFLQRVMEMDKIRLAAIKALADRLADYIQQYDHRLYGKLYRVRRPDQVRLELIRAANRAQDQSRVLLPFDEFTQVFFVDEGNFLREDWFLAYDLLLIRLIEQLSAEIITENLDVIEEIDESAETLNEE